MRELKILIPAANPEQILVDFEVAFDLLVSNIGKIHERMPELLSYFEITYIRG